MTGARHILFICSQNKWRSPTAETIFSDVEGIEVASAGLNNDAVVPLTGELVAWADVIFVMEQTHRTKLSSKFRSHLNDQRIVCLDIPDRYQYMDPALIEILERKVNRLLNLPSR